MKPVVRAAAVLLLCVLLVGMFVGCADKSIYVLEYGEEKITANMYSYWLSTYKSYILYYYGNNMKDTDEFWSSVAYKDESGKEVTMEEYAAEILNRNVKSILVGLKLFNDYKLTLDEKKVAEVDADIAEKIEYFGGKEALNEQLSVCDINSDILRDIYLAEEKSNAVYEYLYGDNAAEPVSGAQIDSYYKSMYHRVKYIIIYTSEKIVYDADGNAVRDDEGYIKTEALTDAEKETQLNKVYAATQAISDGKSFEDAIKEYSEVDMTGYENGFYVSANEIANYGYKIYGAASSMETDEIRKLEDDKVTYIIKKYDLPELDRLSNAETKQLASLKTYCAQALFQEKLQKLSSEVIENTEALSTYSVRGAAILGSNF